VSTGLVAALVAFIGCFVVIGVVAWRAYVKEKALPRLSWGTRVHVDDDLVVRLSDVEAEAQELLSQLHAANLLTASRSREHVGKMTFYLVSPRQGGGGVLDPWNPEKYLEGITMSPYEIHVTWRWPGKTALKYELINALLWKFVSSDMAHNEGSQERAHWDVYQ